LPVVIAGSNAELPELIVIIPAEGLGMLIGLNCAPPETHILAPAGKAVILPLNIPPVIHNTSVDNNEYEAEELVLIVIVQPAH
jgi:hypothetical protein